MGTTGSQGIVETKMPTLIVFLEYLKGYKDNVIIFMKDSLGFK